MSKVKMWEVRSSKAVSKYHPFPEDQVIEFDILEGLKTVAIKLSTKSPNFRKYLENITDTMKRIPIIFSSSKPPRVDDIVISSRNIKNSEIQVLIIHNDTDEDMPKDVQKIFASKKTFVPSLEELVNFEQNWAEKSLNSKGFVKFANDAHLPNNLFTCVKKEIKSKKEFPKYGCVSIENYAVVEYYVYIASGFSILISNKKKFDNEQMLTKNNKLPMDITKSIERHTDVIPPCTRTEILALPNKPACQTILTTSAVKNEDKKFIKDENLLKMLDEMQNKIQDEKSRVNDLKKSITDEGIKQQLIQYEDKLYQKDRNIYKARKDIENLGTDVEIPNPMDFKHILQFTSLDISFENLNDEINAIQDLSDVTGTIYLNKAKKFIDIDYILPKIAKRQYMLISNDKSQPFKVRLI